MSYTSQNNLKANSLDKEPLSKESLQQKVLHKKPLNTDLITLPIPQLFKRIAIPASIGFFFNTMYNVVDTYYAGLISTQAVAALALSFPVFFIIIALASGTSTGSTALIAHALGAGEEKKARHYTAQSLSFAFILSVLMTFLGLSIAPFLFGLLGATGDYLTLALNYINIIFYGSLFFVISFVSNASLQASGDTKTFSKVLVAGFFANLLLDPWFMFGWFGFPALGLRGVAYATVFIQGCGALFMLTRLVSRDLISFRKPRDFIPEKSTFLEIAHQGFPASLNMMTVALGIFIITYFVSTFGESAVAAYGIATRIEQIALLPTIGINIATLTLVGQNAGAGRFRRVKEIVEKAHLYGLSIITLGLVIVFFFTRHLMSFFTQDPEVISIGAYYLRIASFIFWAYVILFLNISALQGLKKPLFALWMGLFRQIVGAFLVFYALVNIFGFGLHGVWYGVFVVNWVGALVTLWYARRTFNHVSSLESVRG